MQSCFKGPNNPKMSLVVEPKWFVYLNNCIWYKLNNLCGNDRVEHNEMQRITSYIYYKLRLKKYNNINSKVQ